MATPALGRPFSVREAYDALDEFGRRSGRVRLLLLLHASVPQSFRADLVNLLKMNFLAAEAGTDLSVDADVLLSPLVRPAAAGYYCLDPEVRRHCLALLDAAYRDQRERRSVQVARFLLVYADALERQAALALDAMLAEYLAIERWVALAFMDPNSTAEAFARAIERGLDQPEAVATLRLGSVTAAMSVPLTGHQELLAYARGIDAMTAGDTAIGHRLLDWIGDDELRIGNVTLRSGTRARQRLTRSAPDTAEPGTGGFHQKGDRGASNEAAQTAAHPASAVDASPADAVRVYLIYQQRDLGTITPWADFLFQDFEVIHPVFDGDEAEMRYSHEENLRRCDAAVIFYGVNNEYWIRRQMRELQKPAGYGRTKPAPDIAICCIPPKTPEKQRFRSHEAMVIPQWDGFSPDPWQPFIARAKEHVAARPSVLPSPPARWNTTDTGERAWPGALGPVDVYLSYADIDNKEHGRWIDLFRRALEARLTQLLGTSTGPKVQGGDVSTEVLQLRGAAVFVAIVSSRYLKSERAMNELREFSKAAEARDPDRVSERSRIFKVLRMPVPLASQPSQLQSLLGYEFFKVDPETGGIHEFEILGPEAQRDFWIRLDDLAHDIAQRLDDSGAESGSTPRTPAT